MGKVKWAIDTDEPEDLQQFDVYDGDLPPRGVYRCVVKAGTFKVKTNKNGDDMLNGLLVIEETKGDKKKYNGCPIWFNQNVTDQGAPFIKQMLKAFGLSWKDFVSKTVTDDDQDPPVIMKIGDVKFGDKEPEVRILAKRGSYNGEAKLEVASWLPPRDDDDDDDDPDDGDNGSDGGDDEAPF